MAPKDGMARDFRALIDEIRQRSDLVEIVSGYVALKPAGRNLIGLCPFHTEKSPSFTVSREKGLWHCYGCKAGGDVFKFVEKIDALTFMEAAEHLARRAGIPFEWANRGKGPSTDQREALRSVNEKARDYYRQCLARTPGALEYLRKRGVAETTIESFQLGYAPEGWDALTTALLRQGVRQSDIINAGLGVARQDGSGYDRFRHRLIFPIWDAEGRVIAFGGRAMGADPAKYINTSETGVFVKNRTLYALHLARKAIVEADYAVIVEGYMDALACHQWGFRNVVATMGTAVTAGHLNMLSRLTKKVALAFDSDSAGMMAALRSIPLFEEAGFAVRVVSLPRGEDPDELLKERGPDAFKALLAEARPVVEHRLAMAAQPHDLTKEDERYAYLKEAVQILSEVRDPTDRQLYAARAAEKCFHPDTRMVQWMEDAIRMELARRRTNPQRVGPGGQRSEPPQAVRQARESRLVKAEQGLLRALLNDPEAREQIIGQLGFQAGEFTDPAHRQIAERLYALHAAGQPLEGSAILEGLEENAEAVASKLLLEEKDSTPPTEYIEAVRWESVVRRERELKEAIARGTISQEEMVEYMRITEMVHTKRYGRTSIGG